MVASSLSHSNVYYIMLGINMLPDIWRPWLGSSSLFEEMNREFAEAEDMLSRMFSTVHDIAPSIGNLTEFPYYMAIR